MWFCFDWLKRRRSLFKWYFLFWLTEMKEELIQIILFCFDWQKARRSLLNLYCFVLIDRNEGGAGSNYVVLFDRNDRGACSDYIVWFWLTESKELAQLILFWFWLTEMKEELEQHMADIKSNANKARGKLKGLHFSIICTSPSICI